MKYYLAISIQLATLAGLAQQYVCRGQPYYVWAQSGLNLREAPCTDSRILATIPYGAQICIDSLIDMEDIEVEIIKSLTINPDWNIETPFEGKTPNATIKGKMVKVTYKGLAGFVFSGYLADLEPIYKRKNDFRLEEIFEARYGVLAKFDKGNDSTDYENTEIVYKNGYVFKRMSHVSWYTNTYLLMDKTLREGLLIFENFLKTVYTSNDEPSWYIRVKDESSIGFSEGMFNITLREVDSILLITVSASN